MSSIYIEGATRIFFFSYVVGRRKEQKENKSSGKRTLGVERVYVF